MATTKDQVFLTDYELLHVICALYERRDVASWGGDIKLANEMGALAGRLAGRLLQEGELHGHD